MRSLIGVGSVTACHDLSDGGLLVAIAEMALAGGVGAELCAPSTDLPPLAWWFGEDQARYLVATPSAEALVSAAGHAGVPVCVIGRTGGTVLTMADGNSIPLSDLGNVHENWLPRYMAAKLSAR